MDESRQAEIGDFNQRFVRVRRTQQDILWLQIPMRNRPIVKILHADAHLPKEHFRGGLVQLTVGDDAIEQFSALHQFQQDVNSVGRVVDIVDANDARMAQFS